MIKRPILFSAEMVRAILRGEKTQTRRVMKVQPWPDAIVTVEHYHQTVIDRCGDMQPGPEIFGAHWDDGECGLRCPDHSGPNEFGPRVFQDGVTKEGRPMWCAVFHDFINLQESPAAFDERPWVAIEKLTGGKDE